MFAAILGLALAGPASAATFGERFDLDDLAAAADRVVVGEVLSTRQEVVPDRGIYTVASIYVEEALRGEPEPVIEVRYPGGRVDDLELTVPGAPKLVPGYEVVLFLDDDDRVVGFGQGAFVVEGDTAYRRLSDDVFTNPNLDRDWKSDEELRRHYAAYSLAEVRRAVR